MDVQELLEPLTRGPVPDVEHVHARVAVRRRRRRAVLAVGCVAAIAVLGAAFWLTPRNNASIATVGDPKVETEGQIRHVVDTLFLEGPTLAEKLAQIDDSTGLEGVVGQGMQDERAHRLTLTIVNIDVNDPTAVVQVDFFLSGASAMPGGLLDLRHTGDRWQATRASYCALIATGGLRCPGTDATIQGGGSASTTPGSPSTINEFGPKVRLTDAPLGTVAPMVIRVDGAVTFSFSSSPSGLDVKLEHASSPGGASFSADPTTSEPMVFAGAFQQDPTLGGPWSYAFGVTRSEIARIELTGAGRHVVVDTFAVSGVPQLRFFLVAYDWVPNDNQLLAVGYSADGVRLTDSQPH